MTGHEALMNSMGISSPQLRNDRVGFVIFDTHHGATATLAVGTSRRTLVDRARRLNNRYDDPVREVRYVDSARLGEDYWDLCRDVLSDLYAEAEGQRAS